MQASEAYNKARGKYHITELLKMIDQAAFNGHFQLKLMINLKDIPGKENTIKTLEGWGYNLHFGQNTTISWTNKESDNPSWAEWIKLNVSNDSVVLDDEGNVVKAKWSTQFTDRDFLKDVLQKDIDALTRPETTKRPKIIEVKDKSVPGTRFTITLPGEMKGHKEAVEELERILDCDSVKEYDKTVVEADSNTTQKLPKIKPCPFCGKEGIQYENEFGDCNPEIVYGIGCETDGCYCEGGGDLWCDTELEAIDMWNKRI